MATTARATVTITTLQFLLFFFSSGILYFSLFSLSSPDSLSIPIWKDRKTHQYITHIAQSTTPPISLKLVIDLGGPFLWLDCYSGHFSPIRCRSIQCSAAKTTSGGGTCNCSNNNNNTCHLTPQNTISHKTSSGYLVEDILTFPFPLPTTQAHSKLLFSCAPTLLLTSLASGAKGMLGLGRTRISLPSHLAAAYGVDRKFAICLPPSSSSQGVIFFGDGPYMLHPTMDASKYLMYTPLIGDSSGTDHFIGVKSIKINGKSVPLDGEEIGGTKISTVVPYTTMETSIFDGVTKAFSEVAINTFNMTRVESVAPFGLCFSSNNIGSGRTGVVVPTIDLVLQSEMVFWRIWGSNSMVRVNEDVLCLAILDGELRRISSVVVGGFQLENNLLQFDLASSRLGFSSSLLGRQTTCSPSPGGYSYQR